MSSASNVDFQVPKFVLEGEPNCASTDPEIFFAQESDLEGPRIRAKYVNERKAKAVCSKCPLLMKCLEYALRNEESGIWGGTNESERARLRRSSGIRVNTIRQRSR